MTTNGKGKPIEVGSFIEVYRVVQERSGRVRRFWQMAHVRALTEKEFTLKLYPGMADRADEILTIDRLKDQWRRPT